MATKKSTKKASRTKKPVKKAPTKKRVVKKGSAASRSEPLSGCGEFETHVEGATLYITILGDAEFDASVVVEGDACRTLLPCKIVNGQWEC